MSQVFLCLKMMRLRHRFYMEEVFKDYDMFLWNVLIPHYFSLCLWDEWYVRACTRPPRGQVCRLQNPIFDLSSRVWFQDVGRRHVWHAIITLGKHKWSDGVGRDIPSSPLGSTHGRMTLGVACHHLLWEELTVVRRREWHAIIALEQHTQ